MPASQSRSSSASPAAMATARSLYSMSGCGTVRVRLKGINSVTKPLKDGTTVTYWYAWKGGPRLDGEPGDPEFIASYNRAVARLVPSQSGLLLNVLVKFQNTEEFRGLAPRTQADYREIIDKKIEPEFRDLPIAALTEKRCRGVFKDWRDRLALKSRRQADYAWVVLARVLAVALDRGWVDANPCERGGRLYSGSRRDKIWTLDDELAFLEKAPHHLHLPLTLALWTGQREGDLLKLTWSAYDGTHIRLRQSKTGARVSICVGAPLKAALDATPKRSPVMLLSTDNKPWTEDGFRSSWRKACKKAGIVGVTFNDLRGTAVTRLAIAGCTEAEIVAITGHTLRDVRSILDAHYLHRDPALAEAAIRKLEARTNSPKRAPN
jgi:integrase